MVYTTSESFASSRLWPYSCESSSFVIIFLNSFCSHLHCLQNVDVAALDALFTSHSAAKVCLSHLFFSLSLSSYPSSERLFCCCCRCSRFHLHRWTNSWRFANATRYGCTSMVRFYLDFFFFLFLHAQFPPPTSSGLYSSRVDARCTARQVPRHQPLQLHLVRTCSAHLW